MSTGTQASQLSNMREISLIQSRTFLKFLLVLTQYMLEFTGEKDWSRIQKN